uniref:Uncharacterized protein n=1 Tax=Rhizophora mucronata TaxID=61149 RepID=A0A2P2QZ79_RHIMU
MDKKNLFSINDLEYTILILLSR